MKWTKQEEPAYTATIDGNTFDVHKDKHEGSFFIVQTKPDGFKVVPMAGFKALEYAKDAIDSGVFQAVFSEPVAADTKTQPTMPSM